MLETTQHDSSIFATFTFARDKLIEGMEYGYPEDESVKPRDLQLLLKRIRESHAGLRIRFYGVGEYGDQAPFHPHYHVALFGLRIPAGHIDPKAANVRRRKCDCSVCACWKFGNVHLGYIEEASASYLCGFHVKGMRRADDERLLGRHPEFSRMSLRPFGIGAGAMVEVARALRGGFTGGFPSEMDVPSRIRVLRKMWPLGRYLQQRLRVSLGRDAGVSDDRLRTVALTKIAEWYGRVAQMEETRAQHGHNAQARYQIERSKKGVGL